ncbi:Hsp20/alpha crystallin family protein [Kitasatospora sp. NBC_00240]|uniref:Hsp20/alpha crystallin family protein n=1 Tax=Kitasatospora sp. NBC_00240 TaxID=2903567 RepID=UPI00225BC619|nr:Hsp20/alpha crystallin family protein [Kitasatospora sp. NBC_00240]MCX5208336.1 Hsp20/alpha crystallin family protein [Kitasatospora sp. NBC_00240]
MLMRTDPFRDLDRLAQQLLGTPAKPAGMPLTAFRDGQSLVLRLDLPGIDPASIDLDIERNVLTVRAQRQGALPEGAQVLADERTLGTFTRQVLLGDALDTDRIEADYDQGVLTVRIPVTEKAKPRKIRITGRTQPETPAAARPPREPGPLGTDSRREAINA